MKIRSSFLALAVALACALPAAAQNCGADPGCCGNGYGNGCGNGCGDCGCKMCKLVSTTKKIKVVCFGCKCDEQCIPCPSCPQCVNCENLCAKPGCECNCECDQRPDCFVRWKEWCPGDAYQCCRKKLVKYEAEKEIPWFKWVVVDCNCCGGGSGCGASMPPAVTIQAPPGLRVGQEFEVSEAEMPQLQAYLAKMQTPAQTVAVAPARQATQGCVVPAAPAAAPAVRTSGVDRLVNFIR